MKPNRLEIKTNAMFDGWPTINYANTTMQKLTVKIAFPSVIKKSAQTFFNYTLQDGDTRPDILARKIYGNAKLDWVILYFNQIVDPLFEWPLTSYAFEQFLVAKYGSVAAAQAQVLNYKQAQNRENITIATYNALSAAAQDYWRPIENYLGTITQYAYNDENMEISVDGYTALDANVKQYWDEITSYDKEVTKNDERKIIRLLKPSYIPLFLREYRKALNA